MPIIVFGEDADVLSVAPGVKRSHGVILAYSAGTAVTCNPLTATGRR
ncbi:hypothetical protein H7U32_01640 [Bifidobacterium pullorum subsp. saeculare]|uniref:Uncharacterized protein n=1 Tax=Bifidobacterium pullorum subsp. saeculare TaxID=78257 RepID=A0A939B9B2_9BIFI|nr:hypothetical protein [Bifidobacterium pullorum subsp. saeculare]